MLEKVELVYDGGYLILLSQGVFRFVCSMVIILDYRDRFVCYCKKLLYVLCGLNYQSIFFVYKFFFNELVFKIKYYLLIN